MDRKKAPEKLKWNTADIFDTHKKFEENLKKMRDFCKKFAKFEGKLSKKEILLDFFRTSDEHEKLMIKASNYVMLNHDVDLKNNVFIEDNEKLEAISLEKVKATTFVAPELASLKNEYFEKLLKDPEFNDYEYSIKSILDDRKHILSKPQEDALSTVCSFSPGFVEVRDSLVETDFKFKKINVNGKNKELTENNYGMFLTNKDRNIRTQAYNNLYEIYNQFSKTLAMNYIYFVKMCNSDLKLRNYTSSFEMFNSDKIPYEIYKKLLKNINNHLNLEKDYFKLLKKTYKIADFGFQDVYLTLAHKINKKYTIEAQKQIVYDALAPLGKEYQSLLKTAYENNWIDFCGSKEKRSGGYMSYVYGVHPYVLLNDTGTYDSLSTLAHELGHAMHSYYSSKNQPFAKHDYALFLAEIASTVNEVLLNKYMIKNAKTNDEKLFYLDNYLQHFKGTVFRQTMFSEFEDFAHTKIANGEILSPKILDDEYKSLLTKHFGKVVKIDKNIVHEWDGIPHFYSPYYVYKYATSFISAVYIANSILENKNDMLNKYMIMLKSGSNGYANDILKTAGVDLSKQETFDYAFNDMKKCLNEAKKILNRLNQK